MRLMQLVAHIFHGAVLGLRVDESPGLMTSEAGLGNQPAGNCPVPGGRREGKQWAGWVLSLDFLVITTKQG